MEGGEEKAVSFLGLVLVNHLLQQLIQIITSLATWSKTTQTIEETWGSKATSMKPWKSVSHKKPQEKLPVSLLFFPV